MVHGYVIVIKRTGEDGSKFPVIERQVKIGSSPECSIAINTPFVTGQHCQLIVQDDGQVKIQNFSTTNPTVVNQTQVDDTVLLAHGDVIEVGGRLVRFEYLKDSPYYHELSPPEGIVNEVVAVKEEEEDDDDDDEDEASKPDSSNVADLEQLESSNAADLPTSSAQLESSNMASTPSTAAQFLQHTPDSTKKLIRLTPQTMRILTGRKSLQITKSLVNQATIRRKNDAVRGLTDEDLKKMVAVNGKPSILRTPVKSSPGLKAVGSPFVDLIKKDWIMQSPSLDTIGENQATIEKERTLMASQSTIFLEAEVPLEPAEESSRMSFLLTSSDDKIPSTPSTSKSTTPEKCLIREQPNAHEEPVSAIAACAETPPEVKTPVGSPGAVEPSSPITPRPNTWILANDVVETPPEVITPESFSPFKKPRLSTPGRKTALKTPKKVKTPSPKRTPRVTPSPKRTPKMGLSSKRTPRTTPSPSRTPMVVLGSKPSPRTTPSPVRTPMVTPSPKRTPRMSPATPAFKTPMSVIKGETTPAKSLKKTIKSPLVKTPTPVKRSRSQGSTKKRRSSPRSAKVEKTPSPKRTTKKADSGSGKKVSLPVRRKLRVSLNAKVTKAFGLKSKILSTPDKNKNKALLVLGKAVNSKSQTQMKLHKKVLQKAIKTQNRKKPVKMATEAETSSPKKGSPGKRTPKKTPVTKFSPSSRTPGVRSSKRISSKIEFVRPDFTELSPSALGLAPRLNTSVSKSPFKQRSQKSSALNTPRKASLTPFSAGSSRLGKSTDDKLKLYNTPKKNIADTSVNLMEFYTPVGKGNASPRSLRDSVTGKLAIIECWDTSVEDECIFDLSGIKGVNSPRNDLTNIPSMRRPTRTSPPKRTKKATVQRARKSPKNDLTNIPSIRRLMKTPPTQRIKKPLVQQPVKSPKNDLTNIPSIRKLMKTPPTKRTKKQSVQKPVKSPKNDLTHIPSIRKLMKTPPTKRIKKPSVQRPAKSPRNDLTHIPSIRKLMKTPPTKRIKKPSVQRPVKSPKNDLTHIPSIRRLMKTPPTKPIKKPSVQRPVKSPKNDLTHIPSIRRLMKTPPTKRINKPRVQRSAKSPKNDLTDVTGVKELFSSNEPKTPLESGISSPALGKRTRGAVSTPKTVGTPLRRGRSSYATPQPRALRTRNNTATEQDEPEVVEEAPPARGRRKAAAKPSSPPKRGRRAAKTAITSNTDSSSPSPPKRAKKTSKATAKKGSSEDADHLNETKSPSPVKRGRKTAKAAVKAATPQKPETGNEASSPSPPKRGRVAKAAVKKEVQEDVIKHKSPKTPPKRGRKAAAAKTPTRPRRVVAPVEEISADKEVEKKPAKGRGRATRAKAASPVEASSPSPSPKKRTTRARTQTATRSTRGQTGK